jgi:TPP-dependent pyruvate/acetoin dehydrogenase alpha subunit
MNMASLWKLPVIYVCENNQYTQYTQFTEVVAGEICGRPQAFEIPCESVDGQDVRAVYAAATRAVERARIGQGPSFLVCNTYRYGGHHVGDIDRAYYRSKEEENEWREERDPLKLLGTWLLDKGHITQEALDQIRADTKAAIDDAVQFALDAPYPDAKEVYNHVYV